VEEEVEEEEGEEEEEEEEEEEAGAGAGAGGREYTSTIVQERGIWGGIAIVRLPTTIIAAFFRSRR